MIKILKEIMGDIAESMWKHYVLWSVILVAVCCFLNMELFWIFNQRFFLSDTDGWMRAARVLDWMDNFQWGERIFPYTNPPYGFVLHWTRVCDVIWALLALPFLAIFPLKGAVFWGGMFFSPLFFIFTMIALLWGLKPYLPKVSDAAQKKIFSIVVLFLLYYLNKIDNTFAFHRPDHHSLMCFVFSFNIAAILLDNIEQKFKRIFFAGVFSGIGMWASSAIEGLFVVALVLLVLVINWAFYKRSILSAVYFALGLFVAVGFAWLINPPLNGWWEVDINRLSIVHVVLTGLILASFVLVHVLKLQKTMAKIAVLSILAAVSAGLVVLIFGADKVLVSIYDPQVYKIFVSRINEMKPIPFVWIRILSVIAGFLFLAAFLYKDRLKSLYLTDMMIMLLVTLVVSVCIMRFFPYYNIILGVMMILALYRVLAYPYKTWLGKSFKIVYLWAPVIYLATFLPLSMEDRLPPMRGPVLVDLFQSPELLFKQGVDAVGSPYHTNVEGILDNYKMWYSTDEEELKELIKKHNVQTVYMTFTIFSDFYVNPLRYQDRFYSKVMLNEDIYPWLERVTDHYYRVNYEKF